MISAVETRKQRDLGAEEQAGQTATRLGEAEASLALKEKELMALREAGDAAKAARDAAQGELAKLKAVVDAQTAAAEQRQAAALRETEVHESLLAEVEALRVEVKVKERAVNSALLQSAERGSTADAAQVAAETATAELEKLRRVVAEKATAAADAAQAEMLAQQGKEEAENLSAALRKELRTAQDSLLELRQEMDGRVQTLTTEMSAAQSQGSSSAEQMAALQSDLERARTALSAAAEASLSKGAPH